MIDASNMTHEDCFFLNGTLPLWRIQALLEKSAQDDEALRKMEEERSVLDADLSRVLSAAEDDIRMMWRLQDSIDDYVDSGSIPQEVAKVLLEQVDHVRDLMNGRCDDIAALVLA